MIIITTQCFYPNIGGIEALMTGMAEAIHKSGRDILVIADGKKDESDESKAYNIKRFNGWKPIRRIKKANYISHLCNTSDIEAIYADSWKSVEYLKNINQKRFIMPALTTPICDFGWNAPDFELLGTDGINHSLTSVHGENGTLVMFICNHCPYVKSVIHRIVEDCKILQENGIGIIAVMSNDVNDPKYGNEDSFDLSLIHI